MLPVADQGMFLVRSQMKLALLQAGVSLLSCETVLLSKVSGLQSLERKIVVVHIFLRHNLRVDRCGLKSVSFHQLHQHLWSQDHQG